MCTTDRAPVFYGLTPANAAEVGLVGEPLAQASPGEGVARRLLGDLAYRSGPLEQEPTFGGMLPQTSEKPGGRRPGSRQQVEIASAALKRVFGLGEALAKTLVGLASRIAAKTTASRGARKDGSRTCGPEILATLV